MLSLAVIAGAVGALGAGVTSQRMGYAGRVVEFVVERMTHDAAPRVLAAA